MSWTDTDATIDFGWGRARVHAEASARILHAEAGDTTALETIQTLPTSHLERFSRRDLLTVVWHHPRSG